LGTQRVHQENHHLHQSPKDFLKYHYFSKILYLVNLLLFWVELLVLVMKFIDFFRVVQIILVVEFGQDLVFDVNIKFVDFFLDLAAV